VLRAAKQALGESVLTLGRVRVITLGRVRVITLGRVRVITLGRGYG